MIGPISTRRTVKQIATELHALLAQLNAPPPLTLVQNGHRQRVLRSRP
jgi:hypothetical protein